MIDDVALSVMTFDTDFIISIIEPVVIGSFAPSVNCGGRVSETPLESRIIETLLNRVDAQINSAQAQDTNNKFKKGA